MRTLRLLISTLAILCMYFPSSVFARQLVSLSARFEPDRLGADTTILVGFHVGTATGVTPSPLVGMALRLPAGTNNTANTLGLATCNSATLVEKGLAGCSPNALMGRGTAVVTVPLGSSILFERVRISLLMAPPLGGHTSVLFYAYGSQPVIAQLVFPSLLLGDSGRFGARLETEIPIVPGLPGAPNVTLYSMHASIGPKGIKYHRRAHGVTLAFAPTGFSVPATCPPGGFPFAASFVFADGTKMAVSSTAPCPASHHSKSGNVRRLTADVRERPPAR